MNTMGDSDPGLGPWEYLGYRLIVKIKERTRKQISRSKFLKLNCVADRYLRDELETNIGLPRYWYKYGEILDESSINGEFYHAPAARGFSGQQYLTSREYQDDEFDVNERKRHAIDEAAEWTALRFGKRNAEQIKSYQYQAQAPKEFIRAYSELRERLAAVDLDSQLLLDKFSESETDNQELITNLLDEMLMTYPEDDYEMMYDVYLRWDDTARLYIEGESNYESLAESLDDFIEALSRVELRFVHASNVPDYRMERWHDERPDELTRFEDHLGLERRSLLEGEDPSGELGKVAEQYDETALKLLGDGEQ